MYNLFMCHSTEMFFQILQLTAVDADTGNNARITYRIITSNTSIDASSNQVFGMFPNSGWLYLRSTLDRETKSRYNLVVAASDNGTPSQTATTRITIEVLDTNDNDPVFDKEFYEFSLEENLRRGTSVGKINASDPDIGLNSAIRYSLIPNNSSFMINPMTGEFFVFVFCKIYIFIMANGISG